MPILAANLSTLFGEAPLLDRFALAASAGFTAVEAQFPYAASPDELARALADSGLTLVLINAPAGDMAAGERGQAIAGGRPFAESIRHAADYAARLACPRVHVLTGALEDGLSTADVIARAAANLRWAADELAKAGVTLMLEALNRRDQPNYALPTLADAEALRDRIGRDNVRLQFDAYHVARAGDDPLRALAQYFPVVGHVQIASPIDRGEPDAPADQAFLAALDGHGYSGFVGCEYVPRTDTLAGLAWAARWGLGRPLSG